MVDAENYSLSQLFSTLFSSDTTVFCTKTTCELQFRGVVDSGVPESDPVPRPALGTSVVLGQPQVAGVRLVGGVLVRGRVRGRLGGWQAELVLALLAPGPRRADAGAPPPRVHVPVRLGPDVVVQQRAQPAEEVRVYELAGALPPEVAVVHLVVLVQLVEVRGQRLGRLEVVHVDVRVLRRGAGVVLGLGAHRDGDYVAPQPVDEELLRDVVLAVGVLEGEVELVVLVQQAEALLRLVAKALELAARPVDVHLDVLGQLHGVLQAAVAGRAVGHEPRHLPGFVGRVVGHLAEGALGDAWVVVRPALVRRHQVAVPAVRGGPVEDVVVLDVLRVVRALEEVQDPDLLGRPRHAGVPEVVLVEDGVGGAGVVLAVRQHARVDGALLALEHGLPRRHPAPRGPAVEQQDLLELALELAAERLRGRRLVVGARRLRRHEHELVQHAVAADLLLGPEPRDAPPGDWVLLHGLGQPLAVLHVPRQPLGVQRERHRPHGRARTLRRPDVRRRPSSGGGASAVQDAAGDRRGALSGGGHAGREEAPGQTPATPAWLEVHVEEHEQDHAGDEHQPEEVPARREPGQHRAVAGAGTYALVHAHAWRLPELPPVGRAGGVALGVPSEWGRSGYWFGAARERGVPGMAGPRAPTAGAAASAAAAGQG